MSNSFSVAINGVVPSTNPVQGIQPSCDGGMPSVEGKLSVSDAYVTAGPIKRVDVLVPGTYATDLPFSFWT